MTPDGRLMGSAGTGSEGERTTCGPVAKPSTPPARTRVPVVPEVTISQLDAACSASVLAARCAKISARVAAAGLPSAICIPRVPPTGLNSWLPGWWVITVDWSVPKERNRGMAVLIPEGGCVGGRIEYYWHGDDVSDGIMEGAGLCSVLFKCLKTVEMRMTDGEASSGSGGPGSTGTRSEGRSPWYRPRGWVQQGRPDSLEAAQMEVVGVVRGGYPPRQELPSGARAEGMIMGLDIQTDSDRARGYWNGDTPVPWVVPLWELIFEYRRKLESRGVQVELNWHREQAVVEFKPIAPVARSILRRGDFSNSVVFPTAVLRCVEQAQRLHDSFR